MARVTWSEDARRRLGRYLSRIAREKSARSAAVWAGRIRKRVALLEQFPEIGATVEDSPFPGLREQIVGPYRIVYRYDGTDCLVVTVARAEQDLRQLLDPDMPS